MKTRPIPLALGLVLAATVAVGCKEDETLGAPKPGTAASSSASGTGGSGAQSGEGGSGAGSSDGGAGGAGGAAGTGGAPYGLACEGDLAFQAAGAGFFFPTPQDLSGVFNDLTYDPSTRPFGVLLRGAPNADAEVASSAIDAGAYVASAPTFGAVNYLPGGFENPAVLAKGTMRLNTPDGPIDVPLVELLVTVTNVSSDCQSADATLDAIIPISAADIEIPTDDGPMTIEELAGVASGPMGGNESGWNLRAKFPIEATSFDWSAQ